MTTHTVVTPSPSNKPRDVFHEIVFDEVVGVVERMRGPLRGPETRREVWAHAGLMLLTLACDGARADDDVGFNKSDTNAGRYLGYFLAQGGLLDDVEWSASITMLKKYHGQIGGCPSAEPGDDAREERVMALERARQGAESGEKESEKSGGAFRSRIQTILDEAHERRKVRERRKKALASPEVVIVREGEVWVVTAPYVEASLNDWRMLGRWDAGRRARVVPVKAARALHALLEQHYKGKVAKGNRGPYVIGETTPEQERKASEVAVGNVGVQS